MSTRKAPVATTEGPTQWAETAMQLNSAAIHLLRRLATVDRETGVTASRLSALSVLVFGGACTLTRLAEAEGVSPPTMSGLVGALESDGLVVRERDRRDARQVRISATDAGTRLMHEARARRIATLAEAIEGLEPRHRRQVQDAAPALLALVERLRSLPLD